MDNNRLLQILVEEIIRSPSRQAEIREVRALYGGGFEVAWQALIREGYVRNTSRPGHATVTATGLAAVRRGEVLSIAGARRSR